MGTQDVIANDRRHGYCLRDWIRVRDKTGSVSGSSGTERDTDPDTDDSDTVASRRRQILDVLKADGQLRAPHIAKRLKCSVPTAKRDLAALKQQDAVEFVDAAKTGHYRLTGKAKM